MHNAERGFTRFGPGALGLGALSRAVTSVRGVMRYHTSRAGPMLSVCFPIDCSGPAQNSCLARP